MQHLRKIGCVGKFPLSVHLRIYAEFLSTYYLRSIYAARVLCPSCVGGAPFRGNLPPTGQAPRGGWPTRNSVSPSISGSPADWFRVCRCRLLRKKGIAQTEQRPTTAAKFMLPLAAARG